MEVSNQPRHSKPTTPAVSRQMPPTPSKSIDFRNSAYRSPGSAQRRPSDGNFQLQMNISKPIEIVDVDSIEEESEQAKSQSEGSQSSPLLPIFEANDDILRIRREMPFTDSLPQDDDDEITQSQPMIFGLGDDTLASLLGTNNNKESEILNGILESDTKKPEEAPIA